MDNNLSFIELPNLPQIDLFKKVASQLWERDDVVAIWLGGSFGSGKADRYSDVDLRLAVKANSIDQWRKPKWDDLFGRSNVHHWSRPQGENSSLHHILLDNAEMYDLWVQTAELALTQEPRLILGCRDIAFLERLSAPSAEPRFEFEEVVPAKIAEAIKMYWSNHVKHEKVIYRNLQLMLRDGVYIFSGVVLRFQFILATGKDCDNVTFPPMTIHKLSPVLTVLRDTYGNDLVDGLVPHEWTQAAAVAAIEKLDGEIARLGRTLADRYQFEYPIEVEQVVLQSWGAFKEREGF